MPQDKGSNFDVERANYFQGMMLVDEDFKVEQSYHRQMRWNHNLELHTWGVVRDLVVSLNAGKVSVTEGLAIDASGREVWWKGGEAAVAGTIAEGSSLVIERNQEERKEYPQMPDKHLRLIDTAKFSWKQAADGDLVLARIVNGQPDNSVRRNAAGVRANGNHIDIAPVTKDGALRLIGKVGIGTSDPQGGGLHVKSNAGVLNLEGTDHAYMQWYPAGYAGGRKGWIGYGTANEKNLKIQNEYAGGHLSLLSASGKVGIGVPDPQSALDVNGGLLVRGSLAFANDQGTPYTEGWIGKWDMDGAKWMHIGGITESGARRLLLAASLTTIGGNVGIGTSEPQVRLHLKFPDQRGGNAAVLNLEGTDHVYMQWYPAGYAAGRKGWIGYRAANEKNLTIQNEYADGHLSLLSASGKVGIGVTNPGDDLEIKGNVSIRLGLLRFMNAEGTWYKDNWIGMASNIDGATQWLHIGGITGTDNVRRLVLAASRTYMAGNLGIKTNLPAAALQVRNTPANNGGASFFNDVSAFFVCKENNGGNSTKPPETVMVLAREGIEGQSYANFARFDLGMYGDKKTQLDLRLTDDPNREGNNTPVIMSLRSNGNVGIGTNSPVSDLHIRRDKAGGLGPTLLLHNNGGSENAEARIDIKTYGGDIEPNFRLRVIDAGSWGAHVDFTTKPTGNAGNNPLTSRLYIKSDGYVGISTATPGGRLEIANGVANADGSATANTVKVKFGGTGGDVHHLTSSRDWVFNSSTGAFAFRKLTSYDTLSGFDTLMTLSKDGDLWVKNNITSPKWKVTTVVNQTGPLNINKTFDTGGGTLIIFASGSAFRPNGAGPIGMSIFLLIGGQWVEKGTLMGYTNERDSHKSFVPFPIVVTGLNAGRQTIELRPIDPQVYMDTNDHFRVTVLELPI